MSEIKTLFQNKWINIVEKTTENNGKYIYSTYPWCNSAGVAVLGYKFDGKILSVLGRYEICPAHSDEIELCALTGGYDNSDKYTLEQCALNELQEEGGYIAIENQLLYLGSVRPSKSSDSIIHLYAVDLKNVEKCYANSDGTLGEVGAFCDWVTVIDAVCSKDPLLSTMLMRLYYEIDLE